MPLSPSQSESLARRSTVGFDELDPRVRESKLTAIQDLVAALEEDGWEIARRTDRTTFEMAQWAFQRIETNIAAATHRAVIVLSLHGLLLSGAFLQGNHLVQQASTGFQTPIQALLGVLYLSAAIALWVVFSTVAPRIAKPSSKRSLVFFASIARMEATEFVLTFEATDRTQFVRDLVEEVHALAGLADWKHRKFVLAFRIILYAELPLIALVGILSTL